MALFGSTTRADKTFADQFEGVGDGSFIYRQNQKGAPIKVGSSERDKFVVGFMKARQRAVWGSLIAIIALSVVTVAIFGDANSPGATKFLWVSPGVVLVALVIYFRWAWNAPARALADRPHQGPALEKTEARRVALRRISWGQFALAGLSVVIVGASIASRVDVLTGWGRLWLVGGAVTAVWLGWRIWQKLQADRSSDKV